MKEEFVTYNQALALKELGYDSFMREDCLAYFNTSNSNHDLETKDWWCLPKNDFQYALSAPLKQQVFRWFREKHDLWFRPDYYDEMREYDYQGSIHQLGRHSSLITLGNCKTVEELEAKCIDKLIEIVKNK
jgi:hypothetical protein